MISPWFADGSINTAGVTYGRSEDAKIFDNQKLEVFQMSNTNRAYKIGRSLSWNCKLCSTVVRKTPTVEFGEQLPSWWLCEVCCKQKKICLPSHMKSIDTSQGTIHKYLE